MGEREEKAYAMGREGKDLPSDATWQEKQAHERGKKSAASGDPMKAFLDLMKVVVDQVKEMGVTNWRGYVGGVLIFFESMVILGILLSVVMGTNIGSILIAAFGGGFLFILQKIPVVRQYSIYAYPVLWILGLALSGGFGDRTLSTIVSILVAGAASYGIHFLFSLGFQPKKDEEKIDLAGSQGE